MRVTTNVHRSASSILELFKFVTSLALVSAVSVWLGLIGTATTVLLAPELDHSLVLAGFVFLLVRYYHGNSLHLLEKYAEGSPARRLDLALPTDAFFILAQGLILVALSFAIRSMDFFCGALIALLIVDVVWSWTMIRIDEAPSDGYIVTWFKINLVGTVVLVVARVFTLGYGPAVLSAVLFAFMLVQTIADYWFAWRRYFPAPSDKRLMLGAPFSAKVDANGQWRDQDMRECIGRAYYQFQQNRYAVYSAHVIEAFGADLRKIDKYVADDVVEAKDAAVYVGITDGTISNGMAVELGVAAAFGTNIVLCVKNGSPDVSFLVELTKAHGGIVIKYDGADDLIDSLCKKMMLTKFPDISALIMPRQSSTSE